MKLQHNVWFTTAALAAAMVLWSLNEGIAADNAVSDPTGTWKVTLSKQTNEQTLKLKLTGDKLTGTISRNTGGKSEDLTVEDGKLTGDKIAFATHQFARYYKNNVLQPPDNNMVTHSKFQGKISGDTIKGTVEREYMGNVHTNDWEAKRVGN